MRRNSGVPKPSDYESCVVFQVVIINHVIENGSNAEQLLIKWHWQVGYAHCNYGIANYVSNMWR